MKKLRTAIYVRHSTDKQNPASSDVQAVAYADVVTRHGGVVIDTYVDAEVPGHRRDRPVSCAWSAMSSAASWT